MAISVTQNGRRYKAVITITAGTPIFPAGGPAPIRADRLLIQMLHGGLGAGLVYDDVPVDPVTGAQPAANQVATQCGQPVELQAASQDGISPGGTYEDAASSEPFNPIDLRTFAIDGTNTGDKVLVDAHLQF